MRRWIFRSALAGLLVAAAVAVVLGQGTPQDITPRPQPAISKMRLESIQWWRQGLMAVYSIGYEDGDGNYFPVEEGSKFWPREQVQQQLTQAEQDALNSIRTKVRTALVAELSQ